MAADRVRRARRVAGSSGDCSAALPAAAWTRLRHVVQTFAPPGPGRSRANVMRPVTTIRCSIAVQVRCSIGTPVIQRPAVCSRPTCSGGSSRHRESIDPTAPFPNSRSIRWAQRRSEAPATRVAAQGGPGRRRCGGRPDHPSVAVSDIRNCHWDLPIRGRGSALAGRRPGRRLGGRLLR